MQYKTFSKGKWLLKPQKSRTWAWIKIVSGRNRHTTISYNIVNKSMDTIDLFTFNYVSV